MLLQDIFLSTFWVTTLLIIWFSTDWFLHYTQLLNACKLLRMQYSAFLQKNPTKYFPDFLYKESLKTSNRFVKFLYKMLSCPLCMSFWLALLVTGLMSNLILIAPTYVLSLLIFSLVRDRF